MDDELVTKVWDAVSDRVDDNLRVVTWYDAEAFETRMRPDIREQYTADEDRVVVDDTIVTQLSLPETENAFKTGRLQALVRVFDDAWVVSWTDSLPKKSGFLISVQRHGEVTMDDIEWCLQYLDDEVAPLLE